MLSFRSRIRNSGLAWFCIALALFSQTAQKVAVLSDQELSQLASRSLDLQKDFAAGRLSTTQLTYILIAAVAIVLIIALAAD